MYVSTRELIIRTNIDYLRNSSDLFSIITMGRYLSMAILVIKYVNRVIKVSHCPEITIENNVMKADNHQRN